MSEKILQILPADRIPYTRNRTLDEETLAQASEIIDGIKKGGEEALEEYSKRLGDIETKKEIRVSQEELLSALSSLLPEERSVLERTADRIQSFARAQLSSIAEISVPIPGGRAGHKILPIERAGCYAPGGRYPLPSTVLMTAITARVAGVKSICLACPKPSRIMLAAAAVAGVDELLAVGGAQAIAALAYGVGISAPCDIVVGPGNRYVTAAKAILSGQVKIDMLAGPSELVVFADKSTNPSLVAADLLAQAEHDTDALPALISTSEKLIKSVELELESQLETLTSADIAREALRNGFAVLARSIEEGIDICNQLAPEHLQLMCESAQELANKFTNYGSLFIGENSAEVFGDYGAGPNHVLPTAGSARTTSGLSVFTFLRFPTWMQIDDLYSEKDLIEDTAALARLEELEGHARAAETRSK